MSSQLTFRLQMSAVVCTVVAKKTFKDCVRKPFSTFLAIIQELVGRSENLEGQKYKNKVKNNLKILIAYYKKVDALKKEKITKT